MWAENVCVYNGREKCLNPSPYETLLLLTLATRESADIEELVDDFVTFYAAGQETSSNLLCFALVLTLLHPNVLERYVKIAMSIVVNTVYSAWTNKCSCIYCLLYTSPSPRDATLSRMPSSA